MTLLDRLKAILKKRGFSSEQKLQEMLKLAKEVPKPPEGSGFGTVFIPVMEINNLLRNLQDVTISANLCALWAQEVQKAWNSAFPDPAPEPPIISD
jgi:hypothetical protein